MVPPLLAPLTYTPPTRQLGDKILSNIPTEMYWKMFEHLEDVNFGLVQPDVVRRTYANLILVCRLFYTLGIPLRFRHIRHYLNVSELHNAPYRFRHINHRDVVSAQDDPPYEKHESFLRAITVHPSPVSHLLQLVKSVSYWGWVQEEFGEIRGTHLSDYGYSALFHRHVACLGVFDHLTKIEIHDCRVSYLLIQQIASLPKLEDVTFRSCYEWDDFPEHPGALDMTQKTWKSFSLIEAEDNEDNIRPDPEYAAVLADLAISPHLVSLSATVLEFLNELTPDRLAQLVSLKSLSVDISKFNPRRLAEIPSQDLETLALKPLNYYDVRIPWHVDKDDVEILAGCFPNLKSIPDCPGPLVEALLPNRPVTLLHARNFRGDPAIFATSTASLTSLFVRVEAFKKGTLPPLPCLVDLALQVKPLRTPQYVRDCLQSGSPVARPVHTTVSTLRIEPGSYGDSCEHNLPLQYAYIVEALQDAFPGAVEFSVQDGAQRDVTGDYEPACLWRKRSDGGGWSPRPQGDPRSLRKHLSERALRAWGQFYPEGVLRYGRLPWDVFVDWEGYYESIYEDEQGQKLEKPEALSFLLELGVRHPGAAPSEFKDSEDENDDDWTDPTS